MNDDTSDGGGHTNDRVPGGIFGAAPGWEKFGGGECDDDPKSRFGCALCDFMGVGDHEGNHGLADGVDGLDGRGISRGISCVCRDEIAAEKTTKKWAKPAVPVQVRCKNSRTREFCTRRAKLRAFLERMMARATS